MTESVIAANRFGLGARPGELAQIGSDARDWLTRQVKGSRRAPEELRGLPTSAQVFETYAEGQEARREARKTSQDASDKPSRPERKQRSGNADDERDDDARRAAAGIREKLVPLYLDQVAARYRIAVRTSEPLRERLTHFWSNHFAVSADKVQVLALAGTLENEAIRPNLGGSFLDMLLAVESHPAMILYLDNQASIGPNSKLADRAAGRARRADRKLDINENLAREILELHTLGVHGGYSQADVTAFALALTGWSLGGSRGPLREGDPGKFEFREAMHEPGARTILGKRYADDGLHQPRAVLRDLAAHPATATHVATRLVRHFVADDPPPAAVERVAKAFRDSDGDLATVHRAVLALPEAWANPPPKFKTPHEFVVSTLRMLDHVPEEPRQVAAPFDLLGQRPWTPGSPAGWPDTADRWDGPDALLKRIEWATAMSERAGKRLEPLELGTAALGPGLRDRTRTAIARAASAAQGLTLLLASPEFQRR